MIQTKEAPEKSIKSDGELKRNLKIQQSDFRHKVKLYRKMFAEHQQSARGKMGLLSTITYFNRTVKVLMEALSGVETKHLHLRVTR